MFIEATRVWSLSNNDLDNDDGLLDDNLLDENDLKLPDPESLKSTSKYLNYFHLFILCD